MAHKPNLIEQMEADGRVKGVRCLCGAGFTMMARMPMAESERHIINEFAKYARKGRRIEMLEKGQHGTFCDCKAAPKPALSTALGLSYTDPNQLALFAPAHV